MFAGIEAGVAAHAHVAIIQSGGAALIVVTIKTGGITSGRHIARRAGGARFTGHTCTVLDEVVFGTDNGGALGVIARGIIARGPFGTRQTVHTRIALDVLVFGARLLWLWGCIANAKAAGGTGVHTVTVRKIRGSQAVGRVGFISGAAIAVNVCPRIIAHATTLLDLKTYIVKPPSVGAIGWGVRNELVGRIAYGEQVVKFALVVLTT